MWLTNVQDRWARWLMYTCILLSQELIEVNSGALNDRLRKAVKIGKKHIRQCTVGWSCQWVVISFYNDKQMLLSLVHSPKYNWFIARYLENQECTYAGKKPAVYKSFLLIVFEVMDGFKYITGPGVANMHKTLNVVPRPHPSITPFPGSPIPPPALLPPPPSPSPSPLSHIKPLCGGGLDHLPRAQLHSTCFSLQLCSQKGFICETCHSSNVIYPFDTGDTYQVR